MASQLQEPETPVQLGTSETTIVDNTSGGSDLRIHLFFAAIDTASGSDITLWRYKDGDAAADDTIFLWKEFTIPASEGRTLSLFLKDGWKLSGKADSSTTNTVQVDKVEL